VYADNKPKIHTRVVLASTRTVHRHHARARARRLTPAAGAWQRRFGTAVVAASLSH